MNNTPKTYDTEIISDGVAAIRGFDFDYEVTDRGQFISHARLSKKFNLSKHCILNIIHYRSYKE